MPEGRTDLEIRIKTLADQSGIKLTEDGLQKIKERTQELGATFDENTRSASGVTQAMKDLAQENLRNIDTSDKAAAAAASLGKNVNSVKGAFGGLRDVISGGLNGNILQIGSGFGKIAAAASNASTAMQGVFSQIVGGAAKALPVVGVVSVLIQKWNADARDAEAAMKRWWDQAAASAEAYKVKSAEVKAAAALDLAALHAGVEKLADGYSKLISRMDTATARAKEVAAAEKELALSAASTPEEKAAIEKKFADTALTNDAVNADLRIRNAEEAKAGGRQEVRNAEAKVREAEAEAEDAAAGVRAYGTKTSEPSLQAVANWRAAKDKVAAAKANLGEVQDRLSREVFTPAQDQIDGARHTKQVTSIRQKTSNVEAARPASASPAVERSRFADKDAVSAASFRGEISPQQAVGELQKLKAENSLLTKAVTTYAVETSKEAQKAREKIRLAQQNSLGGG